MITTTYTPNPDEKLVPTMVYTNQKVIWGLTLTKKTIRVGTLLQSNAGSKYMNLVDTQILLFGAGQDVRWLKFPLLHIESSQIIAYHTLSPVDESPYYDPDDPHRLPGVPDPGTEVLRRYQHDPSDPGSLLSNAVVSIAQDRDGDMWIGMWGPDGGLDRFDRDTKSFVHFTHNGSDRHSQLVRRRA